MNADLRGFNKSARQHPPPARRLLVVPIGFAQKSSVNRLCRLVCGSALRFRAALENVGAAPRKPGGRSPQSGVELTGRPKAFLTPDGTADSPKTLGAKAVLTRTGVLYATMSSSYP